MVGHVWDQLSGEISIPALGGTATLLQNLRDATEGKIGQINPGDPNSKMIGGQLAWGNTLIVSAAQLLRWPGQPGRISFCAPDVA